MTGPSKYREGRKAAAVLAARYQEDQEGFGITLEEFESPEEEARGFLALADLLLHLLAKEHGQSLAVTAATAARFFALQETEGEQ